MRTGSILEYLLQHYAVDVFCFDQPGAPPRSTPGAPGAQAGIPSDPRTRAERWTTATLSYHQPHLAARAFRNTARLFRGVSPLVDRFGGRESDVSAAASGGHYDIGLVEHFWCAPYGELLRPHCRKLVLDLHNIESLWHHRSASFHEWPLSALHRRFARATSRLEARLIPFFDQVLVTSKPDCKIIAKEFGHPSVHVVPNSIPLVPLSEVPKDGSIVFSGNMEYAPNWMAVRYFSKEIWPEVKRRHPKTRWKIVGKSANRVRRFIETDKLVSLVPDPDDAMIEIAKATVAVVPLQLGTGTRLKIIEAWASATPVVSTVSGAEGLEFEHGRDIVIENDPLRFASAINDLIADPLRAEKLGLAGRRQYEASYTWQSAWNALAACGI